MRLYVFIIVFLIFIRMNRNGIGARDGGKVERTCKFLDVIWHTNEKIAPQKTHKKTNEQMAADMQWGIGDGSNCIYVQRTTHNERENEELLEVGGAVANFELFTATVGFCQFEIEGDFERRNER